MARVERVQAEKDMIEKVVFINRVSKTVKGGRIMKFAALVVVGDGKGTVGFGMGKAGEVSDAIRKGIDEAKKNLHFVSLKGNTIPHEVMGKFGAGRVLMKPAAPGTGVIAGGPVRAVVECAGIKDIRTKALRSNNPCNVVRATMDGLLSLRTAVQVAKIRDKKEVEILPPRYNKMTLLTDEKEEELLKETPKARTTKSKKEDKDSEVKEVKKVVVEGKVTKKSEAITDSPNTKANKKVEKPENEIKDNVKEE